MSRNSDIYKLIGAAAGVENGRSEASLNYTDSQEQVLNLHLSRLIMRAMMVLLQKIKLFWRKKSLALILVHCMSLCSSTEWTVFKLSLICSNHKYAIR